MLSKNILEDLIDNVVPLLGAFLFVVETYKVTVW